jgi:hypothetical protein
MHPLCIFGRMVLFGNAVTRPGEFFYATKAALQMQQ